MARFREVIETPLDRGAAFAYIADFTTAAEWDPGILESKAVDGGEPRVGSRYDVVADFRGRSIPFRYEIRELEPERRIVIRGEGDKATSDDTIVLEDADGRTRVTYEAALRMKGIWRAAEPFLGGTFAEMGRKALAGLEQQLNRRAAAG
jgi:carbon monoxide dehydrogenase subunit G